MRVASVITAVYVSYENHQRTRGKQSAQIRALFQSFTVNSNLTILMIVALSARSGQ